MQHYILHLDLDSFFVSVERVLNPSLNGKPVIVGGTGTRGVVSSCSYEARKMGVRSAMNLSEARRLCPNGIYLAGRMKEYSRFSKMVTDLIAEQAPLFEKASVDEFYIDLTGMDKYFGCWEWSCALRRRIIQETGLPISFGLSVNKMLAKMATNEAKPNGQLMIELGKEQEFLAPKPVGKIPSCGEKTVAFLNSRGIYTIGDVRQFTPQAMEQMLGKNGLALWHKAHGVASDELHPYQDAKSISSECTFEEDTDDSNYLKKVLMALAEKLSAELRGDKLQCGCVAVKIRYSDFSTHTKQTSLSPTSNSKLLLERIMHVFDGGYEEGRLVRLIGIRYTNLSEAPLQMNMFEDREKDVKLYQAMDKVKSKYGSDKLLLAQNLHTGNLKHNLSCSGTNKDAKRLKPPSDKLS